MMIKYLLCILISSSSSTVAQTLIFDTIKTYHYSSLEYSIQGADSNCVIDGKKYPASFCNKLSFEDNPLWTNDDVNPKLYFTKMYNLGDTLLSTTFALTIEMRNFGPYREYYSDGSIKIKGQFLFFGTELDPYLVPENSNCKTGKWYYYRPNGELYKIEFYKKNKLRRVKGVNMNSSKNYFRAH